jgi:hypothetical protein
MESSLGSGPRKEGGGRMLFLWSPLGYLGYLYDQRGIHSTTLGRATSAKLKAGYVYFTHLPMFIVGIKWENYLLLPFFSLSLSSASPRLTHFDLNLKNPALIKMPFISGSSSVGR